MCHRGSQAQTYNNNVTCYSSEEMGARQGNWSGKRGVYGRKASNQGAVKERLIHLLLDVGVHNPRAPLAGESEELSR